MAYDARKAADYFQRKKAAGQQEVEVACKTCGGPTAVKKYRLSVVRKNGKNCAECVRRASSCRLRSLRASQTREQRSAAARVARSKMKTSASDCVRRQWETIRSNPEMMAEVSERRKSRSAQNWRKYTTETKHRIISSLLASSEGARSKLSDRFRQMLVDAGVYDGFVSEECFHGFCPDEINHDLRIIVEVYGDVYHCNPKDYPDESEYVPVIQRTVGEQRLRDRRRLACFYRHGYDVVVVWESNIRSNSKKEVERVRELVERKRQPK